MTAKRLLNRTARHGDVAHRFESLRSFALTPQGDAMNSTGKDDQPRARVPRAAVASGLVAFLITGGAVSWATPDGNLVVTLVPALAVGLTVFGLVSWRFRRASA